MLHGLKRATTALTAVLAAYLAYALFAVPLIEPEITLPTPSNVTPIPPDEKRSVDFSELFPEGAWELDDERTKEFDTDYGTLLFQEFNRLDDGRVELRPFAAVLYTSNSDKKEKEDKGRPIVLRAPDGAELKFDEPVRLDQTKVGRLVGGRLLGEIRIYSPPTSPEADDRLDVVTRNIQLSGSRIFTPHDVQFKLGPHWGSGRNLTIESVAPDRKDGGTKPAIGEIKSLELVHVDKVHLQPSKKEGPPDQLTRTASKPPAPLEVTCRGPFVFDFEKSIGSFEDNVDVLRIPINGPADQLNARMLEIHFQDKEKDEESNPSNDADEQKSSAMPRMDIDRIVATGDPVIVRSAYDMEAQRIEYEMGADGHVGTLWADGPGRIYSSSESHNDQKSHRPFAAHWKKELIIQPDNEETNAGESDKHVASLMGGAVVQFGDDSEFSAREVHLWVMKLPEFLGRPKDAKTFDFAPEQLLARHNVRIRSPQLTAKTGQLEAWFVNQPDLETRSDPTNDSTGKTSASPFRAISSRQQKNTPRQSFDVVGDSIRLQLEQIGKKTEVRVVNVFDHVRIVETRTKRPDEIPLVMEGHVLLVGRQPDERSVVEIVGKPAKIAARGLSLAGDKINLDQIKNELKVEGAGRMTFESNKPGRQARSVVTWTDHMRFDGLTAHFEKEIEARGSHELKEQQTMTSVVTSGSLDATLTDRILFTATDKANEIELQSMSFADGARGQTNTFDIRQQLVAVSNVESYRLAYDQQKNFFTADGPGWLTDIRRGESPLKRRQPGRDPKPKVDSNQLYYSRVDFQRGAQGDLNKNEVHFVGRVRGVYGPIHDWSGRLVLDRNRPLSKDIFVLNCDHLIAAEFGQSIEGEEVYDFIAQGNAFIQSAEFDARGDRVSYSQAKDLAVLEGNPREDATLRRHARAGRLQAQQAAARRIFYSPSRDDVRVDDVRQIELSQ